MNRRDFLFKSAGARRVAELSCQRLYMRAVDTRLVSAGEASASDVWGEEPAAVFDERTLDQLFTDLERDLQDVDVVRVLEPSWLTSPEVKRRLDTVLATFRSAGGYIEIAERGH